MMMRCSDILRVFLKVLILCLVCGKQASALSVDDFYPFGPLNGDSELPKGDGDRTSPVIITFPASAKFRTTVSCGCNVVSSRLLSSQD